MDRKAAEKFQDLVVWQKAHQVVARMYRLTATHPKTELFGLVSRMLGAYLATVQGPAA